MKVRIFLDLFIVMLLLSGLARAAEYGTVTETKVIDGVYLYRTTGYGDVGMSGNSIAVISPGGVLVFDTNGLPSTAQTILDKIKKLTGQPVRYVINSHWHWDHWSGNQAYLAAFPDVQIIAQENTRRQLMDVEPKWNDEGLKVQLPAYIDSLDKKLAEKRASGDSSGLNELEAIVKADHDFYDQKMALHKTLPNVTFSESLSLFPEGGEVRLSHARAITIGDAYVFLPEKKVLITGDIMLNPYPYAIGGTYPSDWLKTLETFVSLNPAVIIPGHGDAWTGTQALESYIRLFRTLIQQVNDARSGGSSLEQTQESVGKHVAEFAAMLNISDPQKAAEFKAYFLDVFVARAYKEGEHPLGDLPDGLKN